MDLVNHAHKAFGVATGTPAGLFAFSKAAETIVDIGIKKFSKGNWGRVYKHFKTANGILLVPRYFALVRSYRYEAKQGKKLGWAGNGVNFLAPIVGYSIILNGGLIRHIRLLKKLKYLSNDNILVKFADHNYGGKLTELAGAGMATTCTALTAIEKHRELREEQEAVIVDEDSNLSAYERNMKALDTLRNLGELLSGGGAYFGIAPLMNAPKWVGRIGLAPSITFAKAWVKTA